MGLLEKRGILIVLVIAPFVLLFFSLKGNYTKADQPMVKVEIKKDSTPAKDNSATEDSLESKTTNEIIQLGLELANKGKIRAALGVYEVSMDRGDESAIVYNNVCAAYLALREFKNAIGYCEEAIRIDQNFQLAKNNLNYARAQLETAVEKPSE